MASSTCSKYPRLEEIDLQVFLSVASLYLGWDDHPDGIIMDVGCGSGDNSTRHIATLFPNVQKVVAIDSTPCTITLAKKNQPHTKIEFHVADIEDGSTLTPWLGKVSKVISANCFNFLSDQAAAFRNVYNLLVPGGEAAILFCTQSRYFDFLWDLIAQTRWKKYFMNMYIVVPESHIRKYDDSHYQMILEEIGFQVVLCEDEDRSYMFQSVAECRNSVTDSWLTDFIPADHREEFRQAIFETFIKHNPVASSGHPRLIYRVLSVLVKKPL